MTKLLSFTLLISLSTWAWSNDIISDLEKAINTLDHKEQATITYNFEGCYGPYQHGTITLTRSADTLFFHEKNFDDKGKEGISQSGYLLYNQIEKSLDQLRNERSKEILGNRINYSIESPNETLKGSSDIQQRHFVNIFHPFTNVFPEEEKKEILPGVRTGGFVH